MIPPKVRIVLAKPTVIPLFRAAISPFIVVSPFTVYGLRVQDCALALTIGQVRDLRAIAEKTCTPVAVSTLTVAGQHNSKIGALPANGRIKHHDWAYADHFT